jgi:hypothetical protein
MATTLADHLRSLPDDALAAWLRLRPDLVVPVPADVSALAVRAQSRVSVARALDGLDEFTLHILDAARLTRSADGTTSTQAILALAAGPAPRAEPVAVRRAEPATARRAEPIEAGRAEPASVRRAVDRLRALFVLYGPETALHVVASADEVCSPYPAGLGRPAAELDGRTAELCADPARLRRTLLTAPPQARAVLDRLAAGPPLGTVGVNRQGDAVGWLIDNGLLVAISAVGTGGQAAGGDVVVELPREIGLLLRRDSGPLGPLDPGPPEPRAAARDPKAADSAGAGQTMEAVRQTAGLLEALAAEPAPILRAGGMGVRELRRLAKAVGLDEPTAALLLEISYAAGLLGEADAPGLGRIGGDPRGGSGLLLLPTTGYDAWRAAGLALRWDRLARTWLAMTRQAGLVGQRDERDRPVNVLAPEAERPGAPATRRAVLEQLADLEPAAAPDTEELLHLLAWRAPRRIKGREPVFKEVLAEAATLGVTGLGALTVYGRILISEVAAAAGRDPADEDPLGLRADAGGGAPASGAVAATLDALLPVPVDHVLVQADLTVVVPGPPEPAMATELELLAEPESAGGATVYRVTPASVRRALDAGYVADDVHALFARRSRTPVPQALTYLVDDAARRHGGLRAGPAGSYLRSDDEALLAEVLADKRLAPLSLRRLAPTVLVTPYQSGRMLSALREAGYAPVPEDASGATVLTRPKARRAPARASTPTTDPLATPRLTTPRAMGIVEQIRRGDAAARAARRAPVTVRAANGHGVDGLTAVQAHTQALAVLQQAVRERALVWVGYVDAHGAPASRLLRPVSIGAGYLRAEDERTEMLHTFALHRITAAVLDE